MTDIQSAAAEIRRGKKKRRKKNKRKDENITVCPIPYGDHKSKQIAFLIASNFFIHAQCFYIFDV